MVKCLAKYGTEIRAIVEASSKVMKIALVFDFKFDQDIDINIDEVCDDPKTLSKLAGSLLQNFIDVKQVVQQLKNKVPEVPSSLAPAIMALGAYAQSLDPSNLTTGTADLSGADIFETGIQKITEVCCPT